MNVEFPLHFVAGRTASSGPTKHVRDMIEQVLFTSRGERVNRPTFGCGLLRYIFAPNDDALAAGLQFTVQSQLQQWLSDYIIVHDVRIDNIDERLQVTILYTLRASGECDTVTFNGRRPAR